jgi:hypothetical protein
VSVPPRLHVIDGGEVLAFAFADLMRYHGPRSPGGVAIAFKALERALPLLQPGGTPQRREVAVATAFGGPGARDGFECVLRAVGEQRYTVDAALERPGLGTRARFVFRLTYGDRVVSVALRDGFVTAEFLALAGVDGRTPEQEARLTRLKRELADRVMSAPAADVYDVIDNG